MLFRTAGPEEREQGSLAALGMTSRPPAWPTGSGPPPLNKIVFVQCLDDGRRSDRRLASAVEWTEICAEAGASLENGAVAVREAEMLRADTGRALAFAWPVAHLNGNQQVVVPPSKSN